MPRVRDDVRKRPRRLRTRKIGGTLTRSSFAFWLCPRSRVARAVYAYTKYSMYVTRHGSEERVRGFIPPPVRTCHTSREYVINTYNGYVFNLMIGQNTDDLNCLFICYVFTKIIYILSFRVHKSTTLPPFHITISAPACYVRPPPHSCACRTHDKRAAPV
jgi:hypothetical protein